ncbi:hypothetical protein BD779DRAFT_1472124 [Infundibulicybe gibba]|nr:hypothetical protein BD779DRAFT_1472124 [Infundibulicybe gibba]
MHFTKLLSLVFFAALASHVQAAGDVCCGCFAVNSSDFGFCIDGTKCTPYSTSSGATAIMGVESGVRSTPDPSPSKYYIYSSRSHLIVVASTGLTAAGTTEDHFNAADTDNDGQLTFEEWASSDQNKNMDKGALVARWAKFDSGNLAAGIYASLRSHGLKFLWALWWLVFWSTFACISATRGTFAPSKQQLARPASWGVCLFGNGELAKLNLDENNPENHTLQAVTPGKEEISGPCVWAVGLWEAPNHLRTLDASIIHRRGRTYRMGRGGRAVEDREYILTRMQIDELPQPRGIQPVKYSCFQLTSKVKSNTAKLLGNRKAMSSHRLGLLPFPPGWVRAIFDSRADGSVRAIDSTGGYQGQVTSEVVEQQKREKGSPIKI